jgi:predicted nucleotidyltransferase
LEVDSQSLRRRIATEAADLLYSGLEKEFKQAKLKAARTLKGSFLPTNLEVALELDRMADEKEGSARKERLIRMRREALKTMRVLSEYHPLLVGSVWRGAIHHDSDIDIVAYCDEPEDVLKLLKQASTKITQTEWVAVTKKGKRRGSFHVYAESPDKEKVEVKVSGQEDAGKIERCETYGDEIRGLNIRELERLLKENPTRRFIPGGC